MAADPSPDVSVVIPTHNRKQYLQKAIASCFDGNTAVDVEVIVVNDGSTDSTRAFLDELSNPHVRPIHQSSKGAQIARNTGLEAARGRYVKFLDDDDWLPSGSLAAEVACLEESGADVEHGRIRIYEQEKIGEGERKLASERHWKDAAATVLRGSMWTVPHKFLFRREAIRGCNWDPDLSYHQDYAFLIDIACRGMEFVPVNQVVGVSRRHDGPRIADTKATASPTDYYGLKVNLIKRGVRLLEERDLLRHHHRRAAAAGIWNWAHIVAAYDLDVFEEFYAEIHGLVPDFTPERSRSLLRALDVCLGVRGTERVLYPGRRAKNAIEEFYSA